MERTSSRAHPACKHIIQNRVNHYSNCFEITCTGVKGRSTGNMLFHNSRAGNIYVFFKSLVSIGVPQSWPQSSSRYVFLKIYKLTDEYILFKTRLGQFLPYSSYRRTFIDSNVEKKGEKLFREKFVFGKMAVAIKLNFTKIQSSRYLDDSFDNTSE